MINLPRFIGVFAALDLPRFIGVSCITLGDRYGANSHKYCDSTPFRFKQRPRPGQTTTLPTESASLCSRRLLLDFLVSSRSDSPITSR